MLLSNWPPSKPDLVRRPGVTTKYTQQKWCKKIKSPKLRPSVKIGDPQTPTRTTNIALKTETNNNRGRKTNPGGKVLAATPTRTGRRAFSARDKVTVKKNAAKG